MLPHKVFMTPISRDPIPTLMLELDDDALIPASGLIAAPFWRPGTIFR